MSGTSFCLPRLLALLLALPSLPLAAQSYRDLAKEAALKGDNEKAVLNYELALNSAMKVFNDDDVEIVIRRGELGEAYRALGRWKEAIEQLDYAWRRSRFDAEAQKRWGGKEGDLAMGFGEKLGRACQAAGRYEDAVMVFQTALSDAGRTGRPEADLLAYSGLLADTLLLLKRDEEAAQAMAQAEQVARKLHASEPPALARDLSSLSMLYYGQLRYDKALPLAEQALALALDRFPGESRDVGLYQSRVGALMILAGGDVPAAEALLKEARDNILKQQTQDAQELMLVELSLARIASHRGEFDLCQKHAGEAWRLLKMHYPSEHPETGKCLRQLGDNFVELNMSEDAAGLYARALTLFEASLGKDHPLTTDTRQVLAAAEARIKTEQERAVKEKAMTEADTKAKVAAAEKEKAEAEAKAKLEAEEKKAKAQSAPAKSTKSPTTSKKSSSTTPKKGTGTRKKSPQN